MPVKTLVVVILVSALSAGCQSPAPPPRPTVPASTAVPTSSPIPGKLPCLESGDQNTINDSLRGSGDAAVLCPGAVFELSAPVIIDADFQKIYTMNYPTDDTRAILRIAAANVTTALLMRDHDGAMLSNVIVDGSRGKFGAGSGDALVYAGGFSDGQILRGNKIMNTRTWSSLQIIQGFSDSQPCQNALIENNEIGPAGTSDNLAWADGISLACTKTSVRGNVITDATDGGIVVFGAPGSVIEGNTIRAETRTLLGGINMVDSAGYAGDYTGTIVRNNVIDAAGAVIRIGLGMGQRVWVCLPANSTEPPLRGGTVTGNTLRGDNMQYGFAVDGVSDWTVTGNVDEARHSGSPSVDCGGVVASAPAGFLYNPVRSMGTFQPEFLKAHLDLALWAVIVPRPGQ